ncbi:hypothetical protein H0H87_011696, partial [Tephrocybe sp. NHM501043]
IHGVGWKRENDDNCYGRNGKDRRGRIRVFSRDTERGKCFRRVVGSGSKDTYVRFLASLHPPASPLRIVV